MKRIWQALLYSLSGFCFAWKDEAAFRQEVYAALVLVPLAFLLAPNRIALVLMLGSIALVFIVELLNTAVEASINRIGPEIHPLSKKAKDVASAAVMAALLNVVLVWGLLLL